MCACLCEQVWMRGNMGDCVGASMRRVEEV